MSETVSVRDLRNHGGAIIDAVSRGGSVVITRDGTAVAEVHPLPRVPLTTRELIRRRRTLPPVTPEQLRADIDDLIDPSL